jgi:hypothetical protein
VRFRTSGELRRIDVWPMLDLLQALRDEWADLRFDDRGRLVNPLTGDTVGAIALMSGRHRRVGSVYRVEVAAPNLAPARAHRAEPRREGRGRGPRHAGRDWWSARSRRRPEAGVRAGVEEVRCTATIRGDHARRLAFRVEDENARWTLDIDVEHARPPRAEVSGQIDLTAVLEAEGTPGCLAGLLGGTGEGCAVLDTGPLEHGGRLLEVGGRANRFRGDARLDVRSSATRWAVAGDGVLRARGLGRLLLRFCGRRIRRSIERGLADLGDSSAAWTGDLERDVAALRAAVETEGAPAPFVRRAFVGRAVRRGATGVPA